jgi:radical SAM superfamily enzyme YgiQ (UPF0313 family)
MRVLLVAPHWLFVYENYAELSKAVNFHPPLGLATLAAVAEAGGHEARVIDAEAQGLSVPDIMQVVRDWQPDVLGVTVTTPVLGSAALIAAEAKAVHPAIITVAGGPHITLTGAETLQTYPQLDYTLGGEGELTFPAFLAALAADRRPSDVPGIHWRDGERVAAGPPNAEAIDLDTVPLPDRTKFDLQRYVWSVPGAGLQIMASLQASRGCPLRCIFCSEDRLYPKAIRWKSVDRVMAELQLIHETTPARHIVFLDDTITLHRKWAVELFTRMRDAGFGFTFECETTANRLDDELVQLMVEAGLRRVNCGIENGDPEMLKKLGKGVKLDAIAPTFARLKKYGVETRGSVILGNPWETRKTVWRTLRFIWGLKDLDQAYINIAAPYPGTVLRDMAIRGEGGVTLHEHSYEALRRYGGGVMTVNDLTPAYLARMQRLGTLVFYARPRRFVYNLRRAGLKAAARNIKAFARSFRGKNAPVQVMSGI